MFHDFRRPTPWLPVILILVVPVLAIILAGTAFWGGWFMAGNRTPTPTSPAVTLGDTRHDPAAPVQPQPDQQAGAIRSGEAPVYANWYRFTATRAEVVLEFGMTGRSEEARETVRPSHRLAMVPYTAKRFLNAAQYAVQRHERFFGPLVMDAREPPGGAAKPGDETKAPPPEGAGRRNALSAYTNWYRVTGTPEELILEFGLNPQMGQVQAEPIRIEYCLVLNFDTANRLILALEDTINRYEKKHGVLELDIQKRLRADAPKEGR
jgi:Protein of unknown function (DUF3467)